jgi:hypothetical protein
MHFASELWPLYSFDKIERNFKEKGKIKGFFEEWGRIIAELFRILNGLPCKDVIFALESDYPFVRYLYLVNYFKSILRKYLHELKQRKKNELPQLTDKYLHSIFLLTVNRRKELGNR